MSTVPGREFHGRDAELALVRAELERLADGAEAVVVVEGAAGMGKSRLLAEVAAIARSLGIRVGAQRSRSERDRCRACRRCSRRCSTEPSRCSTPASLATLHAQPEQRFWLLRDLQQLLERAALESPLLICDRRRPLGRRRNGRCASHAADAADGIADRLGDRATPAARSDAARPRARTAEARGGALDRPRPTR